jgi:hypothetical protein
MAKTKISEFDSTPANNTDIDSINIAEGCAPSGINNAIRELMSQLKDQQTGASGDGFTVAGTLALTGGLTLDASAGTTGQVLLSAGTGNTPTWGAAFVAGMIMMWSGSIATVPTGWVLCDGSNSTPDLRNKFVIGANADDSGTAKTSVTGSATQSGGSKDAINVSHTHTATSTVTDPGHNHSSYYPDYNVGAGANTAGSQIPGVTGTRVTGITVATTNSTEGSSGTNANLPPYFALAFIMKT